ncbi:hypothetical protein BsWGS_20176 [Bradybaena similaris]
MCGAQALTLVGLLFAVCTHQTQGYTAWGKGECPDNHKLGDVWYPPGKCEKWTCYNGSYGQVGCGAVGLQYDRSTCYETRDFTLPYPECCVPSVVCPGDPGYNAENLSG